MKFTASSGLRAVGRNNFRKAAEQIFVRNNILGHKKRTYKLKWIFFSSHKNPGYPQKILHICKFSASTQLSIFRKYCKALMKKYYSFEVCFCL